MYSFSNLALALTLVFASIPLWSGIPEGSLSEQLMSLQQVPPRPTPVPACVAAAVAGAPRSLPTEILSFQAICAEFRSRIALKIRDMRQNYQTVELRPGEIEFRDAFSERILSLNYERSLNAQKTNRTEWIRYFNGPKEQILEERIETAGTNLEFTAPSTRIYFEGPPDYDLAANEKTKAVLIGSSDNTLFRFNISRGVTDLEKGSEIRYDIFFGLTQIMTIRKYERASAIRVEYQLFSEGALLSTKLGAITFGFKTPNLFRAVVEKPNLYVTDTTRFFLNDEELFGMTSFLKQFNPQLYDALLVTAVIPVAEKLVIPLFPTTVRILNLAASGRFLDDLIRLRTLADQSKTNPAQLPQVSNLINQFISAIQDGTLAITDNRPKH